LNRYTGLAVLVAACSPSPRDYVPQSHDVRVTADDGGGAGAADTYVYVTRRPHGVIALAEARRLSDADARLVVDRIADDLERCATDLQGQGRLVEGAARVVAVAGPDGTPALNVRLAPGEAVAQNALLCLLAPMRARPLPSPSSQSGEQVGLAIEVTWGPNKSAPAPP
jgi:hypothetical protein